MASGHKLARKVRYATATYKTYMVRCLHCLLHKITASDARCVAAVGGGGQPASQSSSPPGRRW